MSETRSTMPEIRTEAHSFSLPEPASGKQVSLADFKDKPLLIVFSCNHCPYVLHLLDSFTEFASQAQTRGLAVAMINSNDVVGYPADSPRKMIELAQQHDFGFPYLYDESQQVARAYRASCTPDFFLFDRSHRLVYRGQYDGSRPGNNVVVSGCDIRNAVDALLGDNDIPTEQIPSMGCNIKWRTGNEPDYF